MQKIFLYIGPFLFVLLCLEAFLSMRSNLHDYKVKDTLANISISLLNLVTDLFLKALMILALVNLQQHAFFHFDTSLFACIILFLCSDLFHYGFHYLEHRSRFFWANHSVHHSSGSYNFSIAIRTTSINSLYRFLIEAPICFLGFDVKMIVLINTIMLLFAFLQHTEFIKKLGWLEYFLNTPSHHRVHHASNEKYLDKNFGMVLIIWDKLFGTFQAEEEKPTYGLTKPIHTNNPIKILTHEWIAMTKDVYKAKNWKERLSFIFLKPGWAPGKENKLAVSAPAKTNKTVCKKCAQCSQKCLVQFEKIRNKVSLMVQTLPQGDPVLIPAPVASSPHTK